MLRAREGERLDTWIESTNERGVAEVRRFALGLTGDLAAVKAGLTLEYSNGQTEGQVNRLKMLKRTMYGGAKFDLLCQRVLHATYVEAVVTTRGTLGRRLRQPARCCVMPVRKKAGRVRPGAAT